MGDKRKVKSKLAINNQSGFMNIQNKDTFFSNQFAFGGLKKADTAVKGFTDSIGFNPMSAIGGLGSSLVNSNGLSTGVGDIMGAVGGIASNIPGIGGVIGAGTQVLGGVVNAAFGSKMNKQFIQDTEQGIQDTSSTVFGGNDSNDLMDQYEDFNFMDNVSRSQVGKDGWFSSKAKKKTRRLNEQINKANVRANNSFGLGIENVATQNNLNASANYYAGGGFMDNILYDTSDQILHPMNNFKKKVEEVTPEGSTIGTMAKLDWMFNFESNAPNRDDRPEPLSKTDVILYKYMGRGKEIKNNTATPSQNNYINSIKMYQKDTKILVPTKKRVTRAQASYNKEYIKDLKKNTRNGGIMGDYPNSKSFLDRFLN